MKSLLCVFLAFCLAVGMLVANTVSSKTIETVDAPDSAGQFGVGHTSFTAIDKTRGNRELPVDIWYPVETEDTADKPLTEYPLAAGIGLRSELSVDDLPVSGRDNQTLILFSHGYRGISTQSIPLMEILASHGFIIVSPTHTGNSQSSKSDSFEQAAANRVPDISFLIDTMIRRNRDATDPFYNRLDEHNVGVVGHSFGGMTAVGAAAGWAGAAPDPRVAAIVPISAVIESSERTSADAGFSAEVLASIRVPVMLIGGTRDTSVPVENNAIAFAHLANTPTVYRVDIIGATHTHFANICSIGNRLKGLGIIQFLWPLIGAKDLVEPYETTCSGDAFPIEEAIRLQNLYVVAFFKRYLLNEKDYDQYLTEAFAEGEAAVDIWVK